MFSFKLAVRPLSATRRHFSTSLPSRLAAVTQKTTPEALSAAALHAGGPMRNDWSREEIQSIYDSPLMDLLYHGVSFFL
jgi:biotin synthase